MTLPQQEAPPKDVSLSWALGERLLVSTGTNPVCRLDDQPTLPPPYLSMFLAAHGVFLNSHHPPYDDSIAYLTLITHCIDELVALSHRDPPLEPQLAPLIAATRHTKLVWHFIHAIYLATADAAANDWHVSHYLSAWYAENCLDAPAQERLDAAARADAAPDGSPHFWHALTQLILRADLVSALNLLTAHINRHNSSDQWASAVAAMHTTDDDDMAANANASPATRPPDANFSSPLILFEAVLSRAPKHTISSRADSSWHDWQRSCANWATLDVLDDFKPARDLLRALAGHPRDIAAVCSSWQQMFVACAVYMSDRAPDGGVLHGGHAFVSDICAAASNYFESPVHISDGALVEAASGNLAEAVVRLEANAPSSWFAAHLAHLLVRANPMPDHPVAAPAAWTLADDTPIGMPEFYLKEFARGLERYPGCWRVAVDYIAACPTHGPSMLVDLLRRMPLSGPSDPLVEKALHLCERTNMRKTHSALCARLAALCLHRDNLGAALTWFLRAKLPKDARNIAHLALQRAQQQGLNSPGSRSLECVVTALAAFADPPTRAALAYASLYHDMLDARAQIAAARNARDDDELHLRAGHFVHAVRSLLRPDGLPRRFWGVVVFETAKALELYPQLLQNVPRLALLELMGALELASGPNCPSELTENLHRRLLFEARAAANSDTPSSTSRLPVKVDDALEHCRNVFVNCVAAKIA